MSPTDRARDRRLLIELSRINNDYGVLQRHALQDLARSRHELAEARGVLGTVAHDLRTPLQAVIGFAEFLLDEDLSPAQRDLAERIASSGRQLSELADELVETVAERAATTLHEPVRLADLIAEVTSQHNLLDPRPGVRVVADILEPCDLQVDGDPTQLRRVLDNLISNALKFSPPHGVVAVALAFHDGAVEIAVSDDGPGIDPSQHEAVFAPFHRAPGTAKVPGVGLGLAIVRQIVERHGGTISVRSRLGRGTTFVIRLPRSDASA